MILRKSLSCNACRPGRSLEELQKIISTGDVGLTIYRYRKPENDSAGSKPKDTIIFYTTRNHGTKQQPEMDLERFERKWPKCVNYCPRCKEMMRRIHIWNQDIASAEQDRQRDLSELFSCPPCKDIIRKFRRFSAGVSAIRQQHSEIIFLTSPRLDDDAAEAELDLKTIGNLKHTQRINKDGVVGAGAAETTGGLGGMEKKKIKEVAASTKYLEEKKKGKASPKAGTNLTTGNLKHTEGINKDRDVGAGAPRTIGGLGRIEKEKMKYVVTLGTKKDLGDKTKGIDKYRVVGARPTGRLGEMKEDETNEIAVLKINYLKEKMKKETEKAEKEVVTPKSNKTPMPELVSDQRDDLQGRKGFKEGIQEKSMRLMKVLTSTEADVQSSDSTDECTQDEEEVSEFIQGNKICKMKHEAVKQDDVIETVGRELLPLPSTKSKRHQAAFLTGSDNESSKDGVLLYQLSDPKYIENGWTQLPKEVLLWKVTMFQMYPAPHTLWWLELNKSTGTMLYRSGEKLATFDDDGMRLYYTNGELAMEYYEAEERNAGGHRVVVYSTCKSEAGIARPRTVLAMFDYAGNGLVYDHAGQLRLKYTQNDGITLDPKIGPHTHWKWHNLNDPPVLKTVSIEKRPRIKDPVIRKQAKQEGASMSKLSLDKNIMKGIKEKKWIKKYVPFQIKMKAFKINEHFSLRIHEQSSILLCFSGGRTNIKINVGMILDPSVVVGEEYVEVQEVQKVHGFEAKPAGSESVERLQRVVHGARAAERARVLRERRLRLSPSYFHH